MKLNAKGSKPTNILVVSLSAEGQLPEGHVAIPGTDLSEPENRSPVSIVRRSVRKLFANFIPPVFSSRNAGNYQPPPKAPIFAVIPKGVCKGCK